MLDSVEILVARASRRDLVDEFGAQSTGDNFESDSRNVANIGEDGVS
jgi:hypothetical protein